MSSPKLLDQVRHTLRLKHFSIRTEEAYTRWIRRFIVFHGKRHPAELGAGEVRAFLSHLATEGQVAASTQNQAFNALLFLYRNVLQVELGPIQDIVRARRPARLPVVFTQREARAALAHLEGTHRLVAGLLYGSGLRLLEGLRLRVKDLDFETGQVVVRDGKGQKDRITMLPARLRAPLEDQLQRVRALHERDLAEGFGAVYVPGALARKYPGAPRSWGWQYVFPARQRSTDPRSGEVRRHHLSESAVQKAVREAIRKAGIAKTGRAATPSGTPSPPTCWRPATTSAPCRSFWGTGTCAPP